MTVDSHAEIGHGHGHGHGHGVDDEHDDGPELSLQDNPLWQQDNVMLHSVGIDIGSSGTQVTFSRLHLRRLGTELTSRYVVVERETLFESDVHLTPYTDDLQIDAESLGELLDDAYAEGGVASEQVDTGVVILTGEALRRRNAERIAAVVSERAGDLVCAAAGHHLEAMLAAYGSGAVLASHTGGSRILNVDIGGGTTKFTLVDSGRIVATAAFHVGGRLLVAQSGTVTRLEPGGRRHAEHAGHTVAVAGPAGPEVLDAVAATMAEELLAVLTGRTTEHTGQLWLTEPIGDLGGVDGLIFSGGVAEYIYGVEDRDFGDLGRLLGERLGRAVDAGRLGPVLPAEARIRATVIGASQHTVQLSGVTSYLSAPEHTLPRRNVPVVRVVDEVPETPDPGELAATVGDRVERFTPPDATDLALAVCWTGPPEYSRLRVLAEALVTGLADRLGTGQPLYAVVDADIARTLGRILHDELRVDNDLVILDGIVLRDFDYVDLGRLRQPSGTVPVTIKSLMFNAQVGPPAPK